jgi:hypothetical protein
VALLLIKAPPLLMPVPLSVKALVFATVWPLRSSTAPLLTPTAPLPLPNAVALAILNVPAEIVVPLL